MKAQIVGCTHVVTMSPETYPEVTAEVERMVREKFAHEFPGVEITYEEWRCEPAHTVPTESGDFTVPDQWMRIVEGLRTYA